MAKVFISFKSRLVPIEGIKGFVGSVSDETYTRFHEILNTRRVQFTDSEVESLQTMSEDVIRHLLTLIVGLNKDKNSTIRKTLTATDMQCAIKFHALLFSASSP